MKTRISTLFFLLLLALSCRPDKSQPEGASSADIPRLLQRPAVIGPAGEMGQMNDLYQAIAGKIRRQPGQAGHWLSLAELFMQEARISGEHGYYYPEALGIIDRQLAAKLPDDIRYRALLDKASVLLSLHQFAEAKTTGEEAVKLNPYDAGIYGVLVDANVELGRYEEAVAMADKMISIRPDIRSYSRASYLREIHGDVPGAIEAMKLAVGAGYPGQEHTEWARLTLGRLYQQYGQLDSAELQYRYALELRPNYPFAIAAQAEIAALRGNDAEAEALLQRACALIPEVGFYVDLAKIYQERGDRPAEVKRLTDDILAMLADDEKAGHRMALEYAHVYLELLDAPEKALEYALGEYRLRPDNIDVNQLLAAIYFRMGKMTDSRRQLDKALHTRSQNPDLLCLDGLLKVYEARREAGEQQIRRAFSLNPNLSCTYCEEAKNLIRQS